MIKIGLIGAGGIGRVHLRNALHLKNCQLVAIAEISKKHSSYARSKGVKVIYDDYHDLVENPAIDCVIIALPNFLHMESAISAAECGKHIFMEKPLARNVEEAREIVSKTQKAGVKIMVGYPLRFSEFADIKKKIDSGLLGDIVAAMCSNVSSGPFLPRGYKGVPSPVPSWWFKSDLIGGGALIDLGSHLIDLLIHFFGDDIISVSSILGHRFDMPFEDSAKCFIKFGQGTSATVNVGWYSPYHLMRIDLFGTAEYISEIAKPPTLVDYVKNIFKRQFPHPAFKKELQYFVDCVESDTDPSPSAEEALKSLEVISEAYRNVIDIDPITL